MKTKTTIYTLPILAAFVAAMFLTACGGSSSVPNTPEAVAVKYYNAVLKGDVKTMSANASKKLQSTLPSASQVKAMVAMMFGENGGVKSVESGQVANYDTSAKVKLKLTFNKGGNDTVTLDMVKENDLWKVDDM